MRFVELTKEEFEKASNNFLGSSFYQSYAGAQIKELTGWKHYFVGVLKDNKLVAISLIIGKKVYLELFVKTVKNWREREKYLTEFGFKDFEE